MKWIATCLLASSLVSQDEQIQTRSMLFQAEILARDYSAKIAKLAPPLPDPQPEACLAIASNWLHIDLNSLEIPAETTLFNALKSDELLDRFQDLGIDAIHLKGLKKSATARIGLSIDPRWGTEADYLKFASDAEERGISLMSDLIGPTTGFSADFFLALRGFGDYPSLYCLIEVAKKDWGLLPPVEPKELSANVPWLTLQELHKRGYIPKLFTPYVKQSDWNTTGAIIGTDGNSHRWIYLRDAKGFPLLNWLTSSYASERLAAGDALHATFQLRQKILELTEAPKSIALLLRKMGAFSARHVSGNIESLQEKSADLLYDHLTPTLFFLAINREDATDLQQIYRSFLDQGIQQNHLVHSLKPIEKTDRELRLLKSEETLASQLLLAFAYAMQPGAFSIDSSQLTGGGLFIGQKSLYGSLASQLQNNRSFAAQLRSYLSARREHSLANNRLVEVLSPQNQSLLLLLYRDMENNAQLLALNFSQNPVEELLIHEDWAETSAINLISKKTEQKRFDSPQFSVQLEGWSGKIIQFRSQYFQP